MYYHLKMLLHVNGSIPTVPDLKSFWNKSAKSKYELLQKEMLENNFDPLSTFS
jgi:hypothetical protein